MFIGHIERPIDEVSRIEVDLEVLELGATGYEGRKAVHRHIHQGGHAGCIAEVEFDQIRHRGREC